MIREALPSSVRSRLPIAWAAIAWERFWPAAGPMLGVLGVFLVLGLFDLLAWLPAWLHALCLVLFLAAFGAGAWRFWRRFVWPSRGAALRRMELASGFAHQPLSLLDGGFAGDARDELGLALWREHLGRVASGLGPIRIGRPRIADKDREQRTLRVALLLLVMIGLMQAGRDTGRRIADALNPHFGIDIAAAAPTVDLWITPPDYTGAAPIYVGAGDSASHAVSVPAGSALLAQIHAPGADGDLPHLVQENSDTVFTALDGQDFKVGAVLSHSGPLAITLGGDKLAALDVTVIPDKPPVVSLRRPVSVTAHQALRIDYQASDDYGVAGLHLELWRVMASFDGESPPRVTQSIEIAVPSPPSRDISDSLFQDLTASPWAGLPVEMRLVASDGIGQKGYGPTTRMILPEMVFHNEVARLLAAWRKQLSARPETAPQVANALAELSAHPVLYRGDFAVFLGLRVAARGLLMPRGGAGAITDAQALMWSMALKLEGGAAAAAQNDLRAAQKALSDALARGASPGEADKLMRQLDAALDRYLKALGAGQTPPSGIANSLASSHSVSADDLKNMLRQAEEMARNGDRQGAEAMLRQLQSILESLRTGGASPAASAARQAMDRLGSLARQQQSLMDRSQQLQNGARAQGLDGQGDGSNGQGQSPPQGQAADSTGAVGQAQQGLRQQLNALRQSMGGLLQQGQGGQALDQAGQAMDRATRSLRRGDAGHALGEQADVMSAMRQAAQAMQQAMQQAGGQGDGQTDPFGREGTNAAVSDQGNMDLTNPAGLQESRRILDELRRRAGEIGRPPVEHDYIDRLLRDF